MLYETYEKICKRHKVKPTQVIADGKIDKFLIRVIVKIVNNENYNKNIFFMYFIPTLLRLFFDFNIYDWIILLLIKKF